jgi:hypothetical protein
MRFLENQEGFMNKHFPPHGKPSFFDDLFLMLIMNSDIEGQKRKAELFDEDETGTYPSKSDDIDDNEWEFDDFKDQDENADELSDDE